MKFHRLIRICNSFSTRLVLLLFLLAVLVDRAMGQWVQTNGPYGGYVISYAVSGTNLYAGTVGGGVFLSTNNGASWTPVNTGLTDTDVQALAASGTNLYAGTFFGGVFLSTNNGASWTPVNAGLTSTEVFALAVSGTNVFAGTYGGVFFSTNNGASWTQVNTGLTSTDVYALAVSGTNVFAGTYGGVFRSTNNGASWFQVNTGLTDTVVYALAVSGANLFAGMAFGGGVFLSTNNGASWTPVNTGLTSTSVYALAVSGTNLFAGTYYGGVFRSTNNGAGWNPVNIGLTSTNVFALAVSGTNVFAGTYGGGVFLSTNNGASWTPANTGLTNTDVYALAESGTNVFAGTYHGGVFLSTNNGTAWTPVNTGLTSMNVFALAVSGANLFAGTGGGGVFLSTNNGASWNPANTGLTNTGVNAFAVIGANVFAGTYGGVFLSTNNGASWAPVNTGLTNTNVNALAANGTNLFAGTGGGGVFLSINNGASWTPVNPGLTDTVVYALAVTGTNLFAGTAGGGVFLSTNNGASWTAVNPGLTDTYVHALAVGGTNLFAGTSFGGVFLSTNSGASWTPVNAGMAPTSVYALVVSGTNLFAGTGGVGVWRRPLSDLSVLSAPVATAGTNVTSNSFSSGWSASPGATGYRLDVATDNAFTGMVSGYNGRDVGLVTSYDVTGLNPNTPYYYRVRAVSPGGTSANSNTISVTTLPNVLGVPTATAPTNRSTTGFTANWSTVTGALSYRLDVGMDSAFTGMVSGYNSRDVGLVTSYDVAGLNPNTPYYYRVRAVSPGGTSANSNTISVTTLLIVLGVPTATAATNVSSAGFTANWTAVTGASSYRLDVATDGAFTTMVSGYNDLNVGLTTSYDVSGLSPATPYHFRVRAANSGGTSANSNAGSVLTLRSYPSTYLLSTTKGFVTKGSLTEYSSSDYQLVGLPGNSSQLISGFLNGQEGSAWEVYWDNGKQGRPQDYYVKYDGGSNFVCAPGKAFWLLHLGDWTINGRVVNSAALNANREASIALTAGQKWNLITNPFDKPISWSNITSVNGIKDSIYAWTSSGWVRADLFAPYQGYLFFNDSNRAFIRAPYDLTLPKVSAESFADRDDWRISVVARSGRFQDETTSFGVSKGASKGLDSYEQRKPRSFACIPDAYFDRKEWDAEFYEFATDVRPGVDELEAWEMKVRSMERKEVELEFVGTERVSENFAVFLADGTGGRVLDLRKNAKYALTPGTQITTLWILVGQPDLVAERVKGIVPTEFALLQNYPNPFNPSTTIPVSIPMRGRVALTIYNVLGEEVVHLFDGILEPGLHFFQWDGKGAGGNVASSGIYVCRFVVDGSMRSVKKMAMVR